MPHLLTTLANSVARHGDGKLVTGRSLGQAKRKNVCYYIKLVSDCTQISYELEMMKNNNPKKIKRKGDSEGNLLTSCNLANLKNDTKFMM